MHCNKALQALLSTFISFPYAGGTLDHEKNLKWLKKNRLCTCCNLLARLEPLLAVDKSGNRLQFHRSFSKTGSRCICSVTITRQLHVDHVKSPQGTSIMAFLGKQNESYILNVNHRERRKESNCFCIVY